MTSEFKTVRILLKTPSTVKYPIRVHSILVSEGDTVEKSQKICEFEQADGEIFGFGAAKSGKLDRILVGVGSILERPDHVAETSWQELAPKTIDADIEPIPEEGGSGSDSKAESERKQPHRVTNVQSGQASAGKEEARPEQQEAVSYTLRELAELARLYSRLMTRQDIPASQYVKRHPIHALIEKFGRSRAYVLEYEARCGENKDMTAEEADRAIELLAHPATGINPYVIFFDQDGKQRAVPLDAASLAFATDQFGTFEDDVNSGKLRLEEMSAFSGPDWHDLNPNDVQAAIFRMRERKIFEVNGLRPQDWGASCELALHRAENFLSSRCSRHAENSNPLPLAGKPSGENSKNSARPSSETPTSRAEPLDKKTATTTRPPEGKPTQSTGYSTVKSRSSSETENSPGMVTVIAQVALLACAVAYVPQLIFGFNALAVLGPTVWVLATIVLTSALLFGALESKTSTWQGSKKTFAVFAGSILSLVLSFPLVLAQDGDLEKGLENAHAALRDYRNPLIPQEQYEAPFKVRRGWVEDANGKRIREVDARERFAGGRYLVYQSIMGDYECKIWEPSTYRIRDAVTGETLIDETLSCVKGNRPTLFAIEPGGRFERFRIGFRTRKVVSEGSRRGECYIPERVYEYSDYYRDVLGPPYRLGAPQTRSFREREEGEELDPVACALVKGARDRS